MNDLLGGATYDPATRGAEGTRLGSPPEYHPRADHHHSHHHDVNRHDARIRAFSLRWPRPVPPQALSLFLELLVSAHGARLLRFKGLVALADDPTRPAAAHAVQHVVHPTLRLDAWPDDDRETRLVFIVQDLDPVFVEGLWAAAAGEPAVDRADPRRRQPARPLPRRPAGLTSAGSRRDARFKPFFTSSARWRLYP